MPTIEADNCNYTITLDNGEIQPWLGIWGSELSVNSYLSHRTFNYGIPNIERIYVNEGKRTIVIKWLTGERTKVKCAKDDTWNVEAGINAAVVKYITKSNNAYYKDIHKKIEYQD